MLGIFLVIASALVFSLAGVLTKMIEADAWTIVCWRGLLGGTLILAYVAWLGRGKPRREGFRLGWRGWLLASVGSAASLAFIFAFKLTYVANVAVIYATAPFMAAALAWWLLREKFQRRTAIAAVFSLLGVIIVVAGGLGGSSMAGDGIALVMTFGNALYMVLIRAFRNTPVVLAGGVSALQLFIVGWFVVDPLAVSGRDVLLLSLFGLAFAVAVILWTEGTRLIPAAEAGLLGSAETPFAILLAWLLLAELPRSQALPAAASSWPRSSPMPLSTSRETVPFEEKSDVCRWQALSFRTESGPGTRDPRRGRLPADRGRSRGRLRPVP